MTAKEVTVGQLRIKLLALKFAKRVAAPGVEISFSVYECDCGEASLLINLSRTVEQKHSLIVRLGRKFAKHRGLHFSTHIDRCASCQTLDGFKKVLDCMKALGFWVERKWEQTRPRDPGDIRTPGQLKVIEHLWEDLSEYEPGAHHTPFRRGFYDQRLKIPALGPQTRAQANSVIEALKNRVQRALKSARART